MSSYDFWNEPPTAKIYLQSENVSTLTKYGIKTPNPYKIYNNGLSIIDTKTNYINFIKTPFTFINFSSGAKIGNKDLYIKSVPVGARFSVSLQNVISTVNDNSNTLTLNNIGTTLNKKDSGNFDIINNFIVNSSQGPVKFNMY